MTTRLPIVSLLSLLPVLSVMAVTTMTACTGDDPDDVVRKPYVDEWETVLEGPAAQLTSLSVGDRITSDNFANRGNIDIIYAEGTDQIKVEMQRFTIAESDDEAAAAFDRMLFWGYDISTPAPPTPADAADLCFATDVVGCYVRNYYEGQLQPVRDGVNFRVTIPRGWDGDLTLTTEDNLIEGLTVYPDRSDITVDGVAGNLEIDMDSGNVDVALDPETAHYAGCAASETCEADGFPPMCGCSEPTNIAIANKNGQASNITVDVGNEDSWYTVIVESRGVNSSGGEAECAATIDCSGFGDCEIDPDYATVDSQERAQINYPGGVATEGGGIRISLVSEACTDIAYVDGPDDYDSDSIPVSTRGDVNVCVGCLDL